MARVPGEVKGPADHCDAVLESGLSGVFRCRRRAGVGHTLWMFSLALTDEPDQRVQVVSAGSEEITSPLTDLVDQKVDEHRPDFLTTHPSSSVQSISGVTT
jgi:hypothetical protein